MENVKPSQFELFHLAEDISEENDVSTANPERAERLFLAYTDYAESRELK
jgi:hypothetical protein